MLNAAPNCSHSIDLLTVPPCNKSSFAHRSMTVFFYNIENYPMPDWDDAVQLLSINTYIMSIFWILLILLCISFIWVGNLLTDVRLSVMMKCETQKHVADLKF